MVQFVELIAAWLTSEFRDCWSPLLSGMRGLAQTLTGRYQNTKQSFASLRIQ